MLSCLTGQGNFYPRPPRGGRPSSKWPRAHTINFYPRPPRGGRLWLLTEHNNISVISTHALREEGDDFTVYRAIAFHLFLPTPSARRATYCSECRAEVNRISTHALREEGDQCGRLGRHNLRISTHALREEGDPGHGCPDFKAVIISTHALREEGD